MAKFPSGLIYTCDGCNRESCIDCPIYKENYEDEA